MELRENESQLFDSIYQAHKNIVFQVAVHYTKNLSAAEEVAQNVFLKLYIEFHKIDLEKVSSWLMRVSRNESLNYLRRLKHEETISIFDGALCDREKATRGIEESYMQETRNEKLEELKEKILEHLYEKHEQWYDVILLICCSGKSQKEAAEELGITAEVLNSRLYRARQWIRRNYKVEYEEVVEWF